MTTNKKSHYILRQETGRDTGLYTFICFEKEISYRDPLENNFLYKAISTVKLGISIRVFSGFICFQSQPQVAIQRSVYIFFIYFCPFHGFTWQEGLESWQEMEEEKKKKRGPMTCSKQSDLNPWLGRCHCRARALHTDLQHYCRLVYICSLSFGRLPSDSYIFLPHLSVEKNKLSCIHQQHFVIWPNLCNGPAFIVLFSSCHPVLSFVSQ